MIILLIISLLSLTAMITIHMYTGNNSRVYFGLTHVYKRYY